MKPARRRNPWGRRLGRAASTLAATLALAAPAIARRDVGRPLGPVIGLAVRR